MTAVTAQFAGTATGSERPVVEPASTPAKAEAPKTEEASRPEWLPEKFRTPEQLATAYQELEKRLGAPKPEDNKPEVKPAEGEQKPEAKPADGEVKPEDKPADGEQKPEDKVAEDLKAQGVDVDGMSERFWATGEIAADDKKVLVEKLSPLFGDAAKAEAMLDQYASSQKLAKEYIEYRTYEPLGGKEASTTMIEWAKSNLSKPQAEAVNSLWASGETEKVVEGSKMLASLYHAANGKAPTVVLTGGNVNTSPEGYATSEAMVTAMSDPRYRTSEDYRNEVAKKIAASKF